MILLAEVCGHLVLEGLTLLERWCPKIGGTGARRVAIIDRGLLLIILALLCLDELENVLVAIFVRLCLIRG